MMQVLAMAMVVTIGSCRGQDCSAFIKPHDQVRNRNSVEMSIIINMRIIMISPILTMTTVLEMMVKMIQMMMMRMVVTTVISTKTHTLS